MEYPGGGEYGGGPDGLGRGAGEFGGDEFGADEYGGAPPSETPMHLHPSELDRLAIGDNYGGGDQLNGDDYYGGAAPPPAPAYGGDEYGNGAGVVDYGAAAPLPPPPAARDEYMEPPSPMDPHCASMGGQSHASLGSIGEDIDITSQGLVEESLERLSRVRGVLGVLILDSAGAVIRTTMDEKEVAKYSSPVAQLLQRAHGVVGLTAGDQLGMLCVRTAKHEMLMCSRDGFSTLVIQDPNAELNVAGMVAGM